MKLDIVRVETREEAEELNSDCAFCKLPKFVISESRHGYFFISRCHDVNCDQHCRFNHESEAIQQASVDHEEIMMIVRGH